MSKSITKQAIAVRFYPTLIQRIDKLRQHTSFKNRTKFIEEACFTYCNQIKNNLDQENKNE